MKPVKIIPSTPAMDGAGVSIKRISGAHLHPLIDPFLMVDEIHSDNREDYMAGFPSHPHRGFETITYLRKGKMQHEDHLGNRRLMTDGGVQWMTTGRGIIHSEMPLQTEGLFHGFQIWLNLPSELKMTAPDYHDLPPEALTQLDIDGGKATLIAGDLILNARPVTAARLTESRTQPIIADIELQAGAEASIQVPQETNLMILVYSGSEANIPQSHMGIFNAGRAMLSATTDLKALILAGQRLKEPVFQYGPFVMNSEAEIREAIEDFSTGQLTA